MSIKIFFTIFINIFFFTEAQVNNLQLPKEKSFLSYAFTTTAGLTSFIAPSLLILSSIALVVKIIHLIANRFFPSGKFCKITSYIEKSLYLIGGIVFLINGYNFYKNYQFYRDQFIANKSNLTKIITKINYMLGNIGVMHIPGFGEDKTIKDTREFIPKEAGSLSRLTYGGAKRESQEIIEKLENILSNSSNKDIVITARSLGAQSLGFAIAKAPKEMLCHIKKIVLYAPTFNQDSAQEYIKIMKNENIPVEVNAVLTDTLSTGNSLSGSEYIMDILNFNSKITNSNWINYEMQKDSSFPQKLYTHNVVYNPKIESTKRNNSHNQY